MKSLGKNRSLRRAEQPVCLTGCSPLPSAPTAGAETRSAARSASFRLRVSRLRDACVLEKFEQRHGSEEHVLSDAAPSHLQSWLVF